MYDLPESFDANRFVDRVLETIGFASNVVTFTFEPQAVLSIQYGYSYRTEQSHPIRTEFVPVGETSVVSLMGASVESCSVFRKRELVIRFTRGGRLRCLETAEPYESYIIEVDGEEWVV